MAENKIAILDAYGINPGDLSWKALAEFGDVAIYDKTDDEDLPERLADVNMIITSKVQVTGELLRKYPKIKYIGSTATGINNIDVASAKALGIAVTNVPAYATDGVAQHTFALILEITNLVGLHNTSVHQGDWANCKYFCYWKAPLMQLSGKSIGIIGYGNIGKKVGEIASAFGMKVNVYSKDAKAALDSDIISLHCPLTSENKGFINRKFIGQMKPGAILINTARGGLINEQDLADALASGQISAYGADVLSTEPPAHNNPLLSAPNCYITPHIAWVAPEMRKAVIDIVTDNLKSYFSGGTLNRVDL